EISEKLEELEGWQVSEGKLTKQFEFTDFAQALGWMVQIGVHADKMNHHPDWSNTYNKVNVELLTHDLDALSTLDVALARKMNELH
ncbi:MAG: 4a-hydroxytetrahydrobiopterin dehydratase, partial [Candidatus Promineifilaceae bacterium]|nr:4a-hydroxytetrahydrobiopterin dehydratase [Candidatus Promineifilaceae bacterium]